MAAPAHFRAHRRYCSQLPAILRCPSDGWQADASTLDLGIAGACVQITDSLETGLRVELQLQAPSRWDPVVLPATVVWSAADQGSFRAGLVFDHADPGPLMALFDLLDALGPEPELPVTDLLSPKA